MSKEAFGGIEDEVRELLGDMIEAVVGYVANDSDSEASSGFSFDESFTSESLTSLSFITTPPMSPTLSDFVKGEISITGDEDSSADDSTNDAWEGVTEGISQGDSSDSMGGTFFDADNFSISAATLNQCLVEFEAILASGSDNAFHNYINFVDACKSSKAESSFELDSQPGRRVESEDARYGFYDFVGEKFDPLRYLSDSVRNQPDSQSVPLNNELTDVTLSANTEKNLAGERSVPIYSILGGTVSETQLKEGVFKVPQKKNNFLG